MPGVQEDMARLSGRGRIDYLQFQAEVFLCIFTMWVSAIYNNSDGAKLGPITRDLSFDVCQLSESVLFVHNLFKYNPSFGRAPAF